MPRLQSVFCITGRYQCLTVLSIATSRSARHCSATASRPIMGPISIGVDERWQMRRIESFDRTLISKRAIRLPALVGTTESR